MGPVPRHRPLPSTLNRYPSLAQRPRPMAARSHVRPAKRRGFYIAFQSQQGACIIQASNAQVGTAQEGAAQEGAGQVGTGQAGNA
jgi:hypothetical protein